MTKEWRNVEDVIAQASEPERPKDQEAVAADSDAAEIERLAKLSRLDYEREREAAAERLGVRKSILDKLVDAQRPHDDGSKQGRALDLPDPKPWPDPVSGHALAEEIAMFSARFLFAPAEAHDLIALWTLHAHTVNAFRHSPRLVFQAPERQCGKTVGLDVVELLTPRAIKTENLSTAVMFRLMEAHQPTLLVDEYDNFLLGNEELRGAVNSGHKLGGQALRCEGDDNQIRAFGVFGPVALAGIGALPPTIQDRSIAIQLVRARRGEVEPLDTGEDLAGAAELCRKAARWAADHFDRLAGKRAALPQWMYNRRGDNWRPLFAIAHLIGWSARLEAAAQKIEAATADDDESLNTMLLRDIQTVFRARGVDRIASGALAAALHELEGRPWPEFGRQRKPISASQIARRLKAFKIASGTVRFNEGGTAKGYHLEAFGAAFERFLDDENTVLSSDPPYQNVTPSQTKPSNSFGDSQNVTSDPDVTFWDSRKATVTNDCDVVTAGPGGNGQSESLSDLERAEMAVADDDEDERAALREE